MFFVTIQIFKNMASFNMDPNHGIIENHNFVGFDTVTQYFEDENNKAAIDSFIENSITLAENHCDRRQSKIIPLCVITKGSLSTNNYVEHDKKFYFLKYDNGYYVRKSLIFLNCNTIRFCNL